jgi:hypothetical protein
LRFVHAHPELAHEEHASSEHLADRIALTDRSPLLQFVRSDPQCDWNRAEEVGVKRSR